MGRVALGLGVIFLFVVGLTREDVFSGMPFFVMGVLLLILFAFYSRISGALSVGKFQIPIVGEHRPHPSEMPHSENQPKQESEHRPSLAEVRKAADKPATRRNRFR